MLINYNNCFVYKVKNNRVVFSTDNNFNSNCEWLESTFLKEDLTDPPFIRVPDEEIVLIKDLEKFCKEHKRRVIENNYIESNKNWVKFFYFFEG